MSMQLLREAVQAGGQLSEPARKMFLAIASDGRMCGQWFDSEAVPLDQKTRGYQNKNWPEVASIRNKAFEELTADDVGPFLVNRGLMNTFCASLKQGLEKLKTWPKE